MTPKLFNRLATRTRRRTLRKQATEAEMYLWQYLRNGQTGSKFHRQYGIGSFIVDFYAPKERLAVELDGGQHAAPNEQARDELRTSYLKAVSVRVLRFWNDQVFNDTETVLEVIYQALKQQEPPPAPPLEKGEG